MSSCKEVLLLIIAWQVKPLIFVNKIKRSPLYCLFTAHTAKLTVDLWENNLILVHRYFKNLLSLFPSACFVCVTAQSYLSLQCGDFIWEEVHNVVFSKELGEEEAHCRAHSCEHTGKQQSLIGSKYSSRKNVLHNDKWRPKARVNRHHLTHNSVASLHAKGEKYFVI